MSALRAAGAAAAGGAGAGAVDEAGGRMPNPPLQPPQRPQSIVAAGLEGACRAEIGRAHV